MARRSYGSGSLVARADANGTETWYGLWRTGGRWVKRALGAKRVPGSRLGLTRTQAEAELRRRMQEQVALIARAERKTVAEAGERYVEHLATVKQRKRTTIQDYRGYLRGHLAPHFGERTLDRIEPAGRSTRAGALLRPHIERVLAALGGAEAAVEDLRGGTARIRLAAFPSALSSFVPAAMRDLRRKHSQLVVEVAQLETREAVERLRGGGADLAVVHYMPGIAVPETADLQRRRLLLDHLYIVLPEGHRLARRDAVSLTDLDGEQLILPRRDTPAGRYRSVVEYLCAEAGFAPRVAYELDDFPAAQAFVAAGIAVVPMHGLILATLPSGATARPLLERPASSRTIEALAPAAARTPAVDDLLDHLANAARGYALKR